jgi:hypothetical protein
MLKFNIRIIAYVTSSIFWDITQCNPLKVNRRFGGTCRLSLQVRRMSQSSSVKASGKQISSETSVDFQRTTWRYVPEDITLHNQNCENLKSYIAYVFFLVSD